MEYEGGLQMRLIVSCPTPRTHAGDANWFTAKASEAARTQAMDHQNPDTFKKYQSKVKQIDLGACFWNEEPDHGSHAIEESMIHHRDPNVPQKLDAATVVEVENNPIMMGIYQQVDILNRKIAGDPDKHEDLVAERAKLYNKAAKLRRAKKGEYIENWWKTSYDEYILGNEFTERDTTDLFDIRRKYMPERARLRENLFQQVPIHSELGRQCLYDMLNLIKSEERVAYYPGESPVDGKCPLCAKEMTRFVIHVPDIFLELTVASIDIQCRSKHILQCRRKSFNAAPYQQRYKNGKRAHRRVHTTFLEWCYLCAKWFHTVEEWKAHCEFHLASLQPRCGPLTFRFTLVAPGFCPFCLGDDAKQADERFQQWRTKATLLTHINSHLEKMDPTSPVQCPHPCCEARWYGDNVKLRHHFFNAHSIEEPRRNCISTKRKWLCDDEEKEDPECSKMSRLE
jgi:hypothetical protein